uniref:Uncharacterized protein n=1 Tax=Glossina austeni TaxID=7395 RepID=A0A1A9VEW4_GLOAU
MIYRVREELVICFGVNWFSHCGCDDVPQVGAVIAVVVVVVVAAVAAAAVAAAAVVVAVVAIVVKWKLSSTDVRKSFYAHAAGSSENELFESPYIQRTLYPFVYRDKKCFPPFFKLMCELKFKRNGIPPTRAPVEGGGGKVSNRNFSVQIVIINGVLAGIALVEAEETIIGPGYCIVRDIEYSPEDEGKIFETAVKGGTGIAALILSIVISDLFVATSTGIATIVFLLRTCLASVL